MELKQGFKQTEVGVIPEDWQVKSMAETGENIIGLTYSPKDVKEYGHLVLRSSNIQNNKLAFENNVFVEMELPKRVIVKENDILICVRNGSKQLIGKCALIDKATEGSAFGAFMSVYRTTSAKYIFHQFQSNVIQRQIDEVMGATINQLTNKNLASFKIPFPKEEAEQTSIATALSNIDELIVQTEKLIDKKKAIKQGVMQDLMKPKEGWVQKKLGDVISEFQNGYGFSAAGYISNGIPIVTMAQIGLDGSFNFNETKVNKWVTSDFNLLKNYHLKDGDLIIAMTDVTPEKNLIGRMAIVETNQTLLLNQRVGLLKLDKNKVNPYFLKVLSNMKDWRTYCIGSASLGVQANIGTKDITNGKMTMPNVEKQNEIAEILIDIDNEIRLAVTKLQKLKYQKLGMMQALLTGKIRLI